MNKNLRSSSFSAAVFPVASREEEGYAVELRQILMRKLTWLVLFAYTLLLFKPAMPVFTDVIAHTFWEQQHLLIVHEVNGKFHVHNEVVKNSRQSDRDKPGQENKSISEEYVPVTFKTGSYSFATIVKKQVSSYRNSCYLSSCIDVDNPPPDACC